MGKFINRDPIGENGGLNLYGFVRNNPINFVDILGMNRMRSDSETVGNCIIFYDVEVDDEGNDIAWQYAGEHCYDENMPTGTLNPFDVISGRYDPFPSLVMDIDPFGMDIPDLGMPVFPQNVASALNNNYLPNRKEEKSPCDEYRKLKSERDLALLGAATRGSLGYGLGSGFDWQAHQTQVDTINNRLLEIAAEQGTVLASPEMDSSFIADSITLSPDRNFSNISSFDTLTANWSPDISIHATLARSASIPGFPSFSIKAYQGDTTRGDVISVVHPTRSSSHYVDAAFFTLGFSVNVGTAIAFLNQLCK
jgi:hypothetical protein